MYIFRIDCIGEQIAKDQGVRVKNKKEKAAVALDGISLENELWTPKRWNCIIYLLGRRFRSFIR